MTGWYFPQAKPWVKGGDLYTPLLTSLSLLFPKFIKKLSSWYKEKKSKLWSSALQSKKLVSLDWLLFPQIHHGYGNLATVYYRKYPGCSSWLILEVLQVYVDEMDVVMAKPLLMALYTSQPSEDQDHIFLLNVWMQLVPEIDTTEYEGRKNVDKLQVCQNTWNKTKLSYNKT